MTEPVKTKLCGTCKKRRLHEHFTKNRRSKDGWNSRCRDCVRAYARGRYGKPVDIPADADLEEVRQDLIRRCYEVFKGILQKKNPQVTVSIYNALMNKQLKVKQVKDNKVDASDDEDSHGSESIRDQIRSQDAGIGEVGGESGEGGEGPDILV